MGLNRAYSGSPARASEAEDNELLERLTMMIATEIVEAVGKETGRISG